MGMLYPPWVFNGISGGTEQPFRKFPSAFPGGLPGKRYGTFPRTGDAVK